MADFTVLSWNVRGLNSAIKRSLVLKYIQQHNPKICILQETHLVGAKIMGLKKAWVCAHYHATYSNYARGVSVLVHRSLAFQLITVKTDPGGRYVIVHALIGGTPYIIIVGIYLPPPADVTLLHSLMHTITQYEVNKVLCVGDFNSVMSNKADRLHAASPAHTGLAQWASTFALTDLWRHFHPSDGQFTCLSTTYRTLSRIDLAFASHCLLKEVASTEILSRGISDHAPLLITIRTGSPGVRGVWRLSKYWICDTEIQEVIPEALYNFWINNAETADPLTLWEAFKACTRGGIHK